MKLSILTFILSIILFTGCSPKQEGTVIARVGSSVLTLEDAKLVIDTTLGPFDDQLERYVSLWINTELLYKEAERQGILNSDLFKNKVEEVKREVAVQKFLQQNIYSDTLLPSDEQMQQYFEQHRDEFFVRDDLIQMTFVGFHHREYASSFMKAISRGETWEQTLERFQKDDSLASEISAVSAAKYYSRDELLIPELWKIAQTLNNQEISFPVKTLYGFFVIQKLGTLKKGDPAPFELVRDEIQARIRMEQRQNKYAELIKQLRQRYSVEVYMPSKSQHEIKSLHE